MQRVLPGESDHHIVTAQIQTKYRFVPNHRQRTPNAAARINRELLATDCKEMKKDTADMST